MLYVWIDNTNQEKPLCIAYILLSVSVAYICMCWIVYVLCVKMWDYQEDIQIHLSTLPIDSIVKESDDCQNKTCGMENEHIHILCLIEFDLCQDRVNKSGLGWCGQRKLRGRRSRNDTGFPYSDLICAALPDGMWWEDVLTF